MAANFPMSHWLEVMKELLVAGDQSNSAKHFNLMNDKKIFERPATDLTLEGVDVGNTPNNWTIGGLVEKMKELVSPNEFCQWLEGNLPTGGTVYHRYTAQEQITAQLLIILWQL